MKFNKKLLQGTLIKRYKRFFVDIKYQNKTITAHCPNSGSMMGLLKLGNIVWFSTSDDPKRKLKYTLEMIEVNKKLVGINTHLTNKIVFEALKNKKIKSLIKFNNIKPEVKFNDKTRFDFLISNDREKCFLEVKNVTLLRKNNIAEFPDAVTARGTKHLGELANQVAAGDRAVMYYLIQRQDCDKFTVAKDIDPAYAAALEKATTAGVEVICYGCKLTPEGIQVISPLSLEI